MKYLSHDSDSSEDFRMQDIIEKYGLQGYGLYWYAVERIAKYLEIPKGIDCILEDDLNRLARKFKISLKELIEIFDYFVQIKAFTKTSDGVYQNLKVLNRFDRYMYQKLKTEGIHIDKNSSPEEKHKVLHEHYYGVSGKKVQDIKKSVHSVEKNVHSVDNSAPIREESIVKYSIKDRALQQLSKKHTTKANSKEKPHSLDSKATRRNHSPLLDKV
jgi:hypothetical protein